MRLSLAAVRGNCHFLAQGAALLRRIPVAAYRDPARPGWAPVGSQYRHVLDHYRAFVDHWESGSIDYDARQRSPEIERDPQAALAQTEAIIAALDRIHVEDANRPVAVQMDCGGGQHLPDWRPSTVGRELQFLVSHTVHHYALIKLLLEDVGVALDRDFGVAPSSIAYRASQEQERPAALR